MDIYEPLRMSRANKPIAAQHAARILQTTPVTDKDLPHYLVAAFTYLCSEVPRATRLLASIFLDGPPTESVDRFRAVG